MTGSKPTTRVLACPIGPGERSPPPAWGGLGSGAVEPILALVGALLVGFGLVSARLSSSALTAPMIFTGAGILVSDGGLGLVELDLDGHAVHGMGEITLTLVLFGDAARIRLAALRHELGLPVRLLGIGMPLTIAAGAGVAKLLMPELTWIEAATLGTILAPTDAALGQAVVSLPAVPARIRQALNVESGLNDGIAVPVVLILLSLASRTAEGQTLSEWAIFATEQVTLGPVAGFGVAWVCGRAITKARRRGWMSDGYYRLSGIGIALLCFSVAGAIGGNGFIAAFVGGMTLGHLQRKHGEPLFELMEAESQLLMLLVFTVLGGSMLGPAFAEARWQDFAYAAASLTVIRMVPVSLSLIGSGLKTRTVLFLGWFGPRGLASVLFALLLLERSGITHQQQVYSAAMLTVLGSVVLHGATAAPFAHRYARSVAERPGAPEHEEVEVHPLRHRRSAES